MTTDILSVIASRDAATTAPETRLVRRWAIVRGDGLGLATQKLYAHARARKLVARAKRLGLDVYTAPFGSIQTTK